MKKFLFAAIMGISILGSSAAFSQDSTKTATKTAKSMKKASKGKTHKAMKKDYKMDKKEIKGK